MNDPLTQIQKSAQFTDQPLAISESLHVGPTGPSTPFENPSVGLHVLKFTTKSPPCSKSIRLKSIRSKSIRSKSIRNREPIAGQPRRRSDLFVRDPALVRFPFVRS